MLKERLSHPPFAIALACFGVWLVNIVGPNWTALYWLALLACFGVWLVNIVGPNWTALYWLALLACIGALIWQLVLETPAVRRRFVCVECQSRFCRTRCRICRNPVCHTCAPTGYCTGCGFQVYWSEIVGGMRYQDIDRKLEKLVLRERKERSKERQEK